MNQCNNFGQKQHGINKGLNDKKQHGGKKEQVKPTQGRQDRQR